jgi:hypothetical protein
MNIWFYLEEYFNELFFRVTDFIQYFNDLLANYYGYEVTPEQFCFLTILIMAVFNLFFLGLSVFIIYRFIKFLFCLFMR